MKKSKIQSDLELQIISEYIRKWNIYFFLYYLSESFWNLYMILRNSLENPAE